MTSAKQWIGVATKMLFSCVSVCDDDFSSIRLTNSMTVFGEKYLTAAVVIIVYIEEVGALIATLCKFAWWNCPRKGWYEWF